MLKFSVHFVGTCFLKVIFCMITAVYGVGCISWKCVIKWHKKFCEGKEDVLCDEWLI